jgi:hypothetical protein
MPTQYSIFANMSLASHKTRRWKTDTDRRDASRRDADSEHQAKKTREAISHDAGKPTSSIATPTLDTILTVTSLGMQSDTTPGNDAECAATRNSKARKSLGMPQGTILATDAQRLGAVKRRQI